MKNILIEVESASERNASSDSGGVDMMQPSDMGSVRDEDDESLTLAN